jgi:primosomal protein N' (replication factor Y) (superfamily II helicase)
MDRLEGPVAVCVDRPVLSLDRPFTYVLSPGLDAGVGSLVQVPFHGRLIRGWVLGSSESFGTRMLGVKKAVSPVRFFDEEMLELLRWVSERYVAPLAAVIGRAVPPRVASEEVGVGDRAGARRGGGGGPAPLAQPSHAPLRGAAADRGPTSSSDLLSSYRNGDALSSALDSGAGAFIVRPAPEDEVAATVEMVRRCLDGGRRAIVLVPEAVPVPATAAAIVESFGDRVAMLVGGDKRARYRTWLEIAAGRLDVVVGTRPAVFAPLANVGTIVVSRESHPAHREDRAPYYHVRDVALKRAELDGAVCVLSALCPSAEASALRVTDVAPTTRRWPPVEVVRAGPEGRAPRLVRALRETHRGFIFAPLPGYGMAQVCRSCGRPAACAACGGALRSEEGTVRCIVCEAPGRCAHCGAADFGLRRGGAERVEEWASTVAPVPVRRVATRGRARLPKAKEILVGGPESVRDLGPGDLELVAILDADLAERRPGLASRERALATWMEAVGWSRPSGRAIVQADRPSDPAIQALVRGNPDRFHADEAARRAAAGFPVGSAVFRIAGSDALEAQLADVEPITMLVSSVGEQTVCLLALEPARVEAFGRTIRDLAARDIVERVEAEPHL